jgi:hypothetical protein
MFVTIVGLAGREISLSWFDCPSQIRWGSFPKNSINFFGAND